jgi:hypothetical protein
VRDGITDCRAAADKTIADGDEVEYLGDHPRGEPLDRGLEPPIGSSRRIGQILIRPAREAGRRDSLRPSAEIDLS